MGAKIKTKDKILLHGQNLLQLHGYNGFSFQDIADQIGIKKASLYDHFATKEVLVGAIIDQYLYQFEQWKMDLENESAKEKLRSQFKVYEAFSQRRYKLCPICALSMNVTDVPQSVQKKVAHFLEVWKDWTLDVLKQGEREGDWPKIPNKPQTSEALLSVGFGGQIHARVIQDSKHISRLGEQIIRSLAAGFFL